MKKILFVHSMPESKVPLWRDGLWAALKLLEQDYEITWVNFKDPQVNIEVGFTDVDFILGWGGFNSPVDQFMKRIQSKAKKGLCIGGNAYPPFGTDAYDVLFYETEWYKPAIEGHKNIVHAFGVNGDIFNISDPAPSIWDYTTVGAFAMWKRQDRLIYKPGYKLAIGEIQKDNMSESVEILGNLMLEGIAVSDMVEPEKLANIYRASKTVYIPADINGGGERAVLEARACGIPVEVEEDNAKLKELLTCPIWDHKYYAGQLKKGIESVT